MSFDILVTDSVANPLFVVEADGPQHQYPPQSTLDALKDAIIRNAHLRVYWLHVTGMHPPLEVVRAEAATAEFDRSLVYPTTGGNICYSTANYPDIYRMLEMEDIELMRPLSIHEIPLLTVTLCNTPYYIPCTTRLLAAPFRPY